MDGLIASVIKRPYVFIFLAAYLFLAWRRWGWRRTLLWLVSGYGIAWLSEFSSIHNGFPYGEYHYIYENMPGELMVAGVPFFDSLSYPFLIFAGFTTAAFMLRKKVSGYGLRQLAQIAILGAALTTLLDVIIDPVAERGAQWFLGEIYYYAHPGWYFGVPLTNFAGWFLVPLAVIAFNMLIWRTAPDFFQPRPYRRAELLYPAFYTGIALFNIVVTFWIGAWKLGLCSSGILLLVIAFLATHKTLNPKS
jgi:uncharacterized membrane protein